MEETPTPPRPPARPWTARLAEAPASVALVVLQVGVLAWATLTLGDTTSTPVLVAAGALERGRVWAGEWWRLGSAVLLHVGWAHLALNAAFGLGWCRMVERAVGTARFLLVYAVAGLAASATSLLAHDVVSAGASGALYGMVGATLVLHRRALPGWRPFLRSRATVLVTVQLAGLTGVLLWARLPIDHAAHGGGLGAGAAAAWLLTSPARRPAAWAALGAALLLLAGAAAWPRPGLSHFGASDLARRVFQALRAEDPARAAALLDEADRAGLVRDDLTYYRAVLEAQTGRLEEAARRLRPLVRGGPPALQAEARRTLAGVARLLGYQRYTGDGAPKDPAAGLAWLEEACGAGDAESCKDAARIRGDAPP